MKSELRALLTAIVLVGIGKGLAAAPAPSQPLDQRQHDLMYMDFVRRLGNSDWICYQKLDGGWWANVISYRTVDENKIEETQIAISSEATYPGALNIYSWDAVSEVIWYQDAYKQNPIHATAIKNGSFDVWLDEQRLDKSLSRSDRNLRIKGGRSSQTMTASGRYQVSWASMPEMFQDCQPERKGSAPELVAQASRKLEAIQQEERRLASAKKSQEFRDYQERMAGVYEALQITGAIINEDAERTQVELDATLARAAAQGEANQQAQLRQQQESQEQARASQQGQSEQAERAAEDAESNRLRQQNAANLAKAKGYLQQAIDNDLDPAIVQGMREGVNTLEEALREDDSPSYSAASADNDDADDLAEQQAAEAQANAKREADAKAAEEAKASRQAEAEAKAAERRASEELAKKEQQQKLANHLAAEQRGIRLRALTCPSGKGSYFVAGTRPNVSPKVANCISVQFEARCPGTQRGQGVIDTFQNYVGGDSCVGDTIRIPELACPADRVGVDVLDVATCS